ncbi:hypothetical protein [Leptolyngbya sp. FACHB-321]|nr:hypothetical protein [Leptolyngbya sp. FACHB-321]
MVPSLQLIAVAEKDSANSLTVEMAIVNALGRIGKESFFAPSAIA